MNTFLPILVSGAILLTLLVVLVRLHFYIHRHPQPDLARLRTLRGCLWFFAVLSVVRIVVQMMHPSAGSDYWLGWVATLAMVACIVGEMQRIQKKLRKP